MAYDDPYFPEDDQQAALRLARQQLAERKAERPAYEMTENAPQTDATPQGPWGRTFSAVTGGRNLENDVSNIRSRLPSGEDYGQALLNQRDVTQEFNNLSGQNLREGYANKNIPQMALGYGQGALGFVNPALAPINAGFDVLTQTAAKFDPRAKAEAEVIGLVGTEGSGALNKGMKIAREMAAEHPFLATAIPAALGHNALPESTEAAKPARPANRHATPNDLGLYSRAQQVLEDIDVKEGTDLQAIINQMKKKDNSVVKELSDFGITDKQGKINPELIEAYKAYPIQGKDDLIALLNNVSPEHIKEIVFKKDDTKNYPKNLEGTMQYLEDVAGDPQKFKDFLEMHNVHYDHNNWIDSDKHERYDFLAHNHFEDAEYAVQNRPWVYPRTDESVELFTRDLAADRNEFENFVNDNEMPGVLAGNPRRDAELDHAMSENGTFEDRMRYLENYHGGDLTDHIAHMITPPGYPQYEQYTMPGGTNYQERIGYLDPAQYGTLHTNRDHSYDLEFSKGDENRLYQTRVKDYLNNKGEKVRFVDESQNDQATAASKEGVAEPLSNFKHLTPEKLLETQGDRLYGAQRNELEVIVGRRKNYAADLESAKYLGDEPAIARIEKDLKQLDEKYKDLLESENTKGVKVDHYIGNKPSDTEWRRLALKRELIDAVNSGMDKLVINNGLNISKRWGKNFKNAYDKTMASDAKSILNELDPKLIGNFKQEDAGLDFAKKGGSKYGHSDRYPNGATEHEPGYVYRFGNDFKMEMARYFDAPGIHKKEISRADEKAAMDNWWHSMDDTAKENKHAEYLKKVDEMSVINITPELINAIKTKGFKHRKSGGRVGKAGGGLSFSNIATQGSEGETNPDGTPKTNASSPVVPLVADSNPYTSEGGGGGDAGGGPSNDSSTSSQAGGGQRDSNNADSTGTTGGNAQKRGGRVSKMKESEHNVVKRALTLSNHGSPLSDAMRIARQHRGRP